MAPVVTAAASGLAPAVRATAIAVNSSGDPTGLGCDGWNVTVRDDAAAEKLRSPAFFA